MGLTPFIFETHWYIHAYAHRVIKTIAEKLAASSSIDLALATARIRPLFASCVERELAGQIYRPLRRRRRGPLYWSATYALIILRTYIAIRQKLYAKKAKKATVVGEHRAVWTVGHGHGHVRERLRLHLVSPWRKPSTPFYTSSAVATLSSLHSERSLASFLTSSIEYPENIASTNSARPNPGLGQNVIFFELF